jgi:hypothetical protein
VIPADKKTIGVMIKQLRVAERSGAYTKEEKQNIKKLREEMMLRLKEPPTEPEDREPTS